MDDLENICVDCFKCNECSQKFDDIQECDNFEEVTYRLTPKGIFFTILSDMGWTELLSRDSEIAWELYEKRTENKPVLSYDIFESIVYVMGWADKNSREIYVAFELLEERMRKNGYLKEEKEEKEC